MGASAMWVIAAMPEARVAEFAPPFQEAVARHAARPERQAAWRAWCEHPDLVPGYFPDPKPGQPNFASPHPAAAAFNALACDMPWDDPQATDLDLLSANVYDTATEPVCVLVRKGSPVAALFHGIGPARARLLPGWMGNFLLTPAEVLAHQSQVEEALTIPTEEQSRVLERVRDWLNGMGDSGDEDAEELVRGPLRCWRGAIDEGLGLCATQTWV